MDDYKAKQMARAAAAAALQAANPHLVPISACKGGSLIAASKNMKVELGLAFPGVKFSIKTRRFSGGDAIDISWIDGPTSKQVDEIIDRYSAGSFDGMTDCYNYGRNAWIEAFGDAKYNQRAAVLDRITQAVQLLGEAAQIAGSARLGMPRVMMATSYGRGRCSGEVDLCAARLKQTTSNGSTWDMDAAAAADIAKTARLGVDCSAWQYLLHESGMRSLMDATAREKWDKAISDGEVPELTEANIRSTFKMLHDSRGDIFERGVVACFKGLAWDYKTNLPQKFGKRVVMSSLTGYRSYERCNELDDLMRVFSVLDGKPEPDHRGGISSLLSRAGMSNYSAKQGRVENDYLEIKTFKNGNGHVMFKRLDLVDKMNKIIAKHYPGALPAPK